MPGTVLLLAASPVGKGCLVDAASVLPVLAAVAPSVLSGTETANVVELADPLEPQAVLTRLRAAATAPGPLTMFVTGQLQLDRRQRLPHLALARTTPATVRYTAFPWHWVTEELRLRPPGLTSVFVDLHTDADTWTHLAGRPLAVGPATALYGRVAPPPPRRTVAQPTYMRAVATILRSGHRPPLLQLHQQALTRTSGEDATARPGAPDLLFAPGQGGPGAPASAAAPVAGAVVAETVAPPFPPGPGQSWAGQPWPPAPGFTTVTSPPPLPQAPPPAPFAAPAPQVPPAPLTPPEPPLGAPSGVEPSAPPGSRPPAPPQPMLEAIPDQAQRQESSPSSDPHGEITAAVRAGRHGEAVGLAGRREEEALRAYGPGSEQVLHWMEVRADLAMFAGDPERSCRTWLAVAVARLDAGQAADAPEVESAVDRAHHQWGRVDDPARARELGAELARLRLRVPGRREGALDHVQEQLRQLQTQA
ncbi:hypothetical protein [Streptomyces sp. NPDC060027]|uniref:hypothetical protein n=1 Tax=Streptomyces sp. NPDC060027 TaxID=3347040 RepID=UPI0036B3E229